MKNQIRSPIVFINTLVFAGVVGMAVYLKWSARDLLWSLWISSLSIGYFTILSGFVGGVLLGRLPDSSTEDKPGKKKTGNAPPAVLAVFFLIPVAFIFGLSRVTLVFALLAVVSVMATIYKHVLSTGEAKGKKGFFDFTVNLLINFPAGIFLIVFFSIHFGGFHFIHSIFLNGFFPLIDEQPFGKTPAETVFMFRDLITASLTRYWFFIAASVVASFDNIFATLKGTGGDFMLEPYKNVIKMHAMIFIIAFAGAAGLHQYVLYAALFLYFFPVGEMVKETKALMTG